jgi:ferrous iron transport protein A
MNNVSLDRLKPGEKGTVDRIQATAIHIRQRLMEMGLTKGTIVEIIRFAPLGDPIEISVRGYRLSLRREEAQSILLAEK